MTMLHEDFEAKLERALEQTPEVAVPEGFAAKVAASLPAVKPRRGRGRASRWAAGAAVMVLTAAMFALAPHATASYTSLAFDMELVVMAQLAGVMWWLVKAEGS